MPTTSKTDNHNPAAKLKLRRYFLDKYHPDGANVFDCCQGDGLIWGDLKRTHPTKSYWGVDIKRKTGRLKIDSVRVLTQPGLSADCIDVDTYGAPWKHWLALLPNITQPTTVFLTCAFVRSGGGNITKEEAKTLGVEGLKSLPMALRGFLSQQSMSAMLATAHKFCTIVEAVEATSNGSARYIGVRLEPKKESEPGP